MLEFEHRDKQYRVGKIDTFMQMNVLARCGPIVGPMFSMRMPSEEEGEAGVARASEQVNTFLEALRKMTDDERRYIGEVCLGATKRRQSNGSTEVWADIYRSGRYMFEDIDNLGDTLQIVARVLREMFSGFLSTAPAGQTGSTELPRPTLVSNG